MAEEMGLFEAIYTTRAIRRFRPDPVPDELLHQVLAAAGQAPSGGNRQPWRFIVIRSAEGRAAIERLHAEAAARGLVGEQSWSNAPVLIIVCAQQPARTGAHTVGPFGQTYPAVENLLLAARALGLGTSITTSFKYADTEVRALLGIPDGYDTTCLLPLGYPDEAAGERHGKKSRQPVRELAFDGHWGTPLDLA